MRLRLVDIESILCCKDSIFGKNTKIYVFGSRLDDSLKGGDIDLYIQIEDKNALFEKKINFLSCLSNKIGEQKVDVVFSLDQDRDIEQEAMQKGVELKLDNVKLEKYFDECDRHLQRIEEAYTDIQGIIPISSQRYENLTKDEVQAIDQYLFRFSKLQDTLGDKIFKLLLSIYEQSPQNQPFIDVLNKLEKLDFINSANEWINLRKIRNEISHSYDNEPEEMSQAINSIVLQKNIIKEIYLKAKNKYLALNNTI